MPHNNFGSGPMANERYLRKMQLSNTTTVSTTGASVVTAVAGSTSSSVGSSYTTSPYVDISPGQVVAAKVAWKKKQDAWIVAEVKNKIGQSDNYLVTDKYPEDSKRPKTYTVAGDKVCPFPAKQYAYGRGERILALWYMEEEKAWSSMFYKAIVIDPPSIQKPRVVRVQFEGESITRYVDVLKTVKPLPRKEWKRLRKEQRIALKRERQQQKQQQQQLASDSQNQTHSMQDYTADSTALPSGGAAAKRSRTSGANPSPTSTLALTTAQVGATSSHHSNSRSNIPASQSNEQQ